MSHATMISPLNSKQLESLTQEIGRQQKPFRILCRGKSVNICTGYLQGGNIIHQTVYWDRPKVFVNQVLEALRTNNPEEKFHVVYARG